MTFKAPKHQSTKLLFKCLLTLFFVVSFSCEDQDEALEETEAIQQQSIIFTKGTLRDFPKLNDFVTKDILEYKANKALTQRTTTEDAYDFTIIDQDILSIQEDSLTTYTIKIVKDEQPENSFSNLIVKVVEDQNTSAKIINYYPTENYSLNIEDNPDLIFEGDVNVESVDYDGSLDHLFRSDDGCTTLTFFICGWSGTHAGSVCWETETNYPHIQTSTLTVCLDNSTYEVEFGGGSSGGSSGEGSTGGSTQTNYVSECQRGSTSNDGIANTEGCTEQNNDTEETECTDMAVLLDVINAIPDTNFKNEALIYMSQNNSDCEAIAFLLLAIQAHQDDGEVDFDIFEQFLNGMDKDCQALAIFRSISKTRDNSNFAQNIWNHFFASSSSNHLNIQDIPLSGNAGARVGIELVSGNGFEDVILMEFDNDHLDTATTLGFVNTFYHELVHAYIISLYHNGALLTEYPDYTDLKISMDNLLSDPDNNTFKEVYKQESHNIYIDFIDELAEAIVAYCNYNNINDVDLVYAKKLVWGSLNGNDIFTDNLSTEEQLEAQTLLAYENFNTGDKKGTKTCN